MKKLLILFLIETICFLSGYADQIILKNTEIIECKVSVVDELSIKYRKNGEKFDREIIKSDVFKVKYENGDEDFFGSQPVHNNSTETNLANTAANTYEHVETEPEWNALPESSKVYHIGDWYCENGVEGVVIWTTPDGKHGRILHKNKWNNLALKNPPAFFTGPTNISLGMNDSANGLANMNALKSFMEKNPQYTSDMFPTPQIIFNLGEGWYIPSIKELIYLLWLRKNDIAYSGDNPDYRGKKMKGAKLINSVLKKHGGKSHNDDEMLSSTESFSEGNGSSIGRLLEGTPETSQFTLLRIEGKNVKEFIRNKRGYAYSVYAFHLF